MIWLFLLVVVAVLLAWPAPRFLPRVRALRRVPGAAVVLWQATSLAAVTAGLWVGPLVVLEFVRVDGDLPNPLQDAPLAALGLAITGVLLARLLLRAHQVGTQLRRARREHREMLDLLAEPAERIPAVGTHDVPTAVRVLEHRRVAAYCIPGYGSRVVLTRATIDALSPAELDAVLAHEMAHLRQRHDLVLEFFTVWHTAVPNVLRSPAGLTEVKFLIEVLADRSAVREVGAVPLARALVQLSRSGAPGATLGIAGSGNGRPETGGAGVLERVEMLADTHEHRAFAALVGAASVVVAALPIVLIALVILAG